MDIVVRSPHGDADVSIIRHEPNTTLGDMIAAVTGQAVPRIALVDGRTVDAATALDDVGLLLGSVVTTEPPLPSPRSDADVDLVQIAGSGAGRAVRLAPGRYRIGPGRRTSADELDIAPVGQAVLELVIESTTASSDVSVSPDGSDVTLDGAAVTSLTRWRGGTLTVGSRAFVLDSPAHSDPPRELAFPDRDGTVEFSRSPRRPSIPERRPVADAVRDATLASPTLWERRPDQPDAFALPIGVRLDGSGVSTVTVDLGVERAIAVSGTEHFRSALARTLLVEACTLHGPTDLDLVVFTSPDRLAQWDWAKWLPHVRLDGMPAIWSSARDIARWADERVGRARPAATSWTHLSMIVLDDPSLWNRRDSPLRQIVWDPPGDVRFVALCDEPAHAPAICTAVISESGDGFARLHSFTRSDDLDDVRAALTEPSVAAQVARALAPLFDVELPPSSTMAANADEPVTIVELIGTIDPAEVVDRWSCVAPRSTVTVGLRDSDHVDVAIADDVTVVVGSSMGDAFDVAATSLLGQCVDRSPDAFWIVPLMMSGDTPRSELLWRLPHATERRATERRATEPWATEPPAIGADIDTRRLLDRVRALLADPQGPDRILVVIETDDRVLADRRLLHALVDATRATDGLALMAITDRFDDPHTAADTLIRVEPHTATIAGVHDRSATIAIGDAPSSAAFTPLRRDRTEAADSLEIRPNVLGRALTPLERRVDQQHARSTSTPDPSLAQVVDLLRDAAALSGSDRASGPHGGRVVVPPALPTRLDVEELFTSAPGDGVPLGVVDDPATATTPTWWWEPGRGSLMLFGSRRSGVEQALSTITLGILDRFAPADVHLVVIESSSARRRALADCGGVVRVVAADRAEEIEAVLDEIGAERHSDIPDGHPRTVLLISDLAQLRRQFVGRPLASRIDDLLAIAIEVDAHLDVIAYAGGLDDAGPFAQGATHRLVGASSDLRELSMLGVAQPSDLDGTVGRCRSFPGGDLVQLATAETSMETSIARRAAGADA